VKSLESLRRRAENILEKESLWAWAFPPRPWDEEDLSEIAGTMERILLLHDDIVNEEEWAEWLSRWKFHQSVQ
jgi:hypothetical protein